MDAGGFWIGCDRRRWGPFCSRPVLQMRMLTGLKRCYDVVGGGHKQVIWQCFCILKTPFCSDFREDYEFGTCRRQFTEMAEFDGPWLQNGPFWGTLDLGTGTRTARLAPARARTLRIWGTRGGARQRNPLFFFHSLKSDFFHISLNSSIETVSSSAGLTPPLAVFLSFVCAASLLVEVRGPLAGW